MRHFHYHILYILAKMFAVVRLLFRDLLVQLGAARGCHLRKHGDAAVSVVQIVLVTAVLIFVSKLGAGAAPAE